jgi:signal recognition particle receptor subunit beta
MVQFNFSERTIKAKVVYYGPPQSGKTTNLEQIHRLTDPDGANRLISLNTAQDRTLFFDLLPFSLGKVSGYDFKIQLYTVPGQVQYNATRRVVLAGADAVVFVADSQKSMVRENTTAFENMKVNLLANRLVPEKVPLVLQYNKQDLGDLISREDLDRALNSWGRKAFPATAFRGGGVMDTFVAVVQEMLGAIALKYNLKEKGLDPAAVPGIVSHAFEALLGPGDATRDAVEARPGRSGPPVRSPPGPAAPPGPEGAPEAQPAAATPTRPSLAPVTPPKPSFSPGKVVIAQPPGAEPAYPGRAGNESSPVSEELLHRAIRSNVELAEALGSLVRELHLGLGTILTRTEQLMGDGIRAQGAGALVGGIRREAARLRKVLRDFGQAANAPPGPEASGQQVPAPKAAVRPTPTPPTAPRRTGGEGPPTLEELVREVVETVRASLGARRITVGSRVAPGGPLPRCSPAGLRRAVGALLEGLSVVVAPGSAIAVRAERKPVLLRGRNGRDLRRDFLMLALTHPPGLGEEDQGRILKGADTGRLGEGYRLVREMGGFLRFATLPQGHLETRVFLPL